MQPNGFLSDLLTFHQRSERYAHYMASLSERRFTTGLWYLDKLIRGVAPGEVMTIIAYSGTFKSALLQNLLQQFAARARQHQIMFSMEMPVEKVFEREIQITNALTGADVEEQFKAITKQSVELCNTAYNQGSQFLLVCEKSRLTVEQIIKYVQVAQSKYDSIGAVGIDYFGLLRADGLNHFEKSEELSYALKDMAKTLGVPVIVLGQTNRSYSESQAKEIEMDAGKGGGGIEAGADFLVGLYHHGDDLIMKLLKNRNGERNKYFLVDINKTTLQFNGLSEWEPPVKEKTRRAV